ncbi:MAG: GNAT family N-acetyltransferase [Burkholderiales bacterium]|nr:GNAT family N-acetyltransferase [Burkholderiales bacterium]MDP3715237.1 GNAT family N-acetyltransferase [Burkholderiales bacterium]
MQSKSKSVLNPVLQIRSALPADFEQWLPLWEGYNSFYKRTVPAEVTRTTWARFFDAYEPMHAVVAEQDGRLLGLVHYLFHRNTAMLAPVCYLQDLFTVVNSRGQGVGRALIEAVYERAQAAGSPRVYWMTQEDNATARRLYDGVAEYSGFIQYRRQF